MKNIAMQEPVKGGYGVFGARVMTKQFNILTSETTHGFSKKPILNKKVTIQPNPVKEALTISNLMDIKQILINDVYGKIVFIGTVINNEAITINTSNYNKGVYFIRLISNTDEIIRTEKVIVY